MKIRIQPIVEIKMYRTSFRQIPLKNHKKKRCFMRTGHKKQHKGEEIYNVFSAALTTISLGTK